MLLNSSQKSTSRSIDDTDNEKASNDSKVVIITVNKSMPKFKMDFDCNN